MAHRRQPNRWRDEDKIALAVIAILASVGSIYGLIAALKGLAHHPTYGNAARAVLAALKLADELD
jgi:hypothetical protein